MDKTLITGGSGALGRAYIAYTTNKDRLIILSRGEHAQAMIREAGLDNLRFILGDVRDPAKLAMAMRGIKTVIAMHALKRIPEGGWNPEEAVATNVTGTLNVLRAAIHASVEKVLLISTDKGCLPVNVYGATKLIAEHFAFIMNDWSDTKISAVRFGNIVGSTGAFTNKIEGWEAGDPPLEVTHEDMTRFYIDQKSAVHFIDMILDKMEGGEVFVPKIPAKRIIDLIPSHVPWTVTGLRPFEKIHETLLGAHEIPYTDEYNTYFRIKYPPYQGSCQRIGAYTSEDSNRSHRASELHPLVPKIPTDDSREELIGEDI